MRSILDFDTVRKLENATEFHLTTTGRRTGKPHRVGLAFIYHDEKILIASERGWRSDWLKNIAKDPIVTLEVEDLKLKGRATILEDTKPFLDVIHLLYIKYFGKADDDTIKKESKDSVLVSIEILE